MKKSILPLFCLCFSFFYFVPDALQAEEQGPWYLVSETELRSIEEYRNSSEAEKQTWLSQVQTLKVEARSLHAQAENLRLDSETLNSQLLIQREQNQALSKSFSGLEHEWLTELSLKNGEIAALNQAIADKNLETQKYKSKAFVRLVIIIAFLVAAAGYAALKILRRFRLI